jgi:hypothetical protein
MRKTIFTLFMALTFLPGIASVNTELFSVDDQELNTEFAQLNELEQFVSANEGITLSDINSENALVSNMANRADILSVIAGLRAEPPAGIPSLIWGLCLSWVGVLIVYFVADDRSETKKAFTGCLIGAAVYVVFVVFYAVILGNAFLFF